MDRNGSDQCGCHGDSIDGVGMEAEVEGEVEVPYGGGG